MGRLPFVRRSTTDRRSLITNAYPSEGEPRTREVPRRASFPVSARRRIIFRVPVSYCYIVECADGTFYTGWTTDPERRLREHNAGRGAQYTRARRPVRLAYVETLLDRSAAMRRERALKALPRRRKLALISFGLQPI